MPHSLRHCPGPLAGLAVFLAIACLGCISHRPADRRITAAELDVIWDAGLHQSIITEVWYRGSTAAGDFFLVIEPGLSNPRERRCWIPATESQMTKRFPLTDDRSQWRRMFYGGPMQLFQPFEPAPATNDWLDQPLFPNRIRLLEPAR